MKGAGILCFADDTGRAILLLSPDRLWNIPGGLIEPGESPRVAAIREFREETGCRQTLLVTADPIALVSMEGRHARLAPPSRSSACAACFAIYAGQVPKEFRAVLDHENISWMWHEPSSAVHFPLHPGLEALLSAA